MKLRAPGKEPILLDPVRSSAGVEAWYRQQLMKLIDAMHKNVLYWVKIRYRDALPALAKDESPSRKMQKTIDKLSKHWKSMFAGMALTMGKGFQERALHHYDFAFGSALAKKGFGNIKFTMNPQIREALDAHLMENVELIKSIPEKYLGEVHGLVMRSVQHGRDLKSLSQDLQERYGAVKSRAALIARDQNNKATALINKVRQKALGLTKAIWRHTGASVQPREEHMDWDGEEYDIDEGMYSDVDGEVVWPGTAINCMCTSQSIIPGYNDEEGEEEEAS